MRVGPDGDELSTSEEGDADEDEEESPPPEPTIYPPLAPGFMRVRRADGKARNQRSCQQRATARTRCAKKVKTKPRPKSLDVTKVRKPRPKPKVNPLASLGLPMPKNMVPLDPSILRPGRGRNMF